MARTANDHSSSMTHSQMSSVPIMMQIISLLPTLAGEYEVQMVVQEFYSWINGIINKRIQSNSHVPLTSAVLQALVWKNPTSLEEFPCNLSKMFGKVHCHQVNCPVSQVTTSTKLTSPGYYYQVATPGSRCLGNYHQGN